MNTESNPAMVVVYLLGALLLLLLALGAIVLYVALT